MGRRGGSHVAGTGQRSQEKKNSTGCNKGERLPGCPGAQRPKQGQQEGRKEIPSAAGCVHCSDVGVGRAQLPSRSAVCSVGAKGDRAWLHAPASSPGCRGMAGSAVGCCFRTKGRRTLLAALVQTRWARQGRQRPRQAPHRLQQQQGGTHQMRCSAGTDQPGLPSQHVCAKAPLLHPHGCVGGGQAAWRAPHRFSPLSIWVKEASRPACLRARMGPRCARTSSTFSTASSRSRQSSSSCGHRGGGRAGRAQGECQRRVSRSSDRTRARACSLVRKQWPVKPQPWPLRPPPWSPTRPRHPHAHPTPHATPPTPYPRPTWSCMSSMNVPMGSAFSGWNMYEWGELSTMMVWPRSRPRH